MSGFEIDPSAVRRAADGIATITRDMHTIGIDRIVGPTDQYGHPDLHSALTRFGTRWQDGVTALLHDADTLSQDLHAALAAYHDTDTTLSTAMNGPR